MLITTFFIDKFKEISLPTPSGNQEEGGVYGDETNYSSWILGTEGDTSDFDGITRTNILYGELYKITLNTGNMFNPQIIGGVPNLNGFMNMDLNDYWSNIVDGVFNFNNIPYTSFVRKQGNQNIYPTLIEYANSVKERIGWVEINRTRASIYYELCSGGKRARSDHFYDITKFIMTAELFDVEDTNRILSLSYQNVNPFTGDGERYYSNNPFNVSTFAGTTYNPFQRISLNPVGSWFTWTNNAQGHFKSSNYTPDNVGGYLDTFPWPRGPMWGQYRGAPKDYLPALVTGNQIGLDADINTGPREIKLPTPDGIGNIVSNVPLLISQKEKHLSTLLADRLANPTQFGTISPISPIYSVDIWGEKRTPEESNTIQLGIISKIQTPSYGVCQLVNGLYTDEGDTKDDSIINDPFGFDSFELDTEYDEVYGKFKFCQPYKKKINNSLYQKIGTISNPIGKTLTKTTFGNVEEYNTSGEDRVIKIGSFNPDEDLSLINLSDQFISVDDKLNYTLEYNSIETSEYNGTVPKSKTEGSMGEYPVELFTVVDGKPKKAAAISETDPLVRNLYQYDMEKLMQSYFELTNGVRESDEFLKTNPSVPYGTYKYKIETEIDENDNVKRTIKIKRNGSDAEPSEFKKSVSFINKTAKNNTTFPKAIGVSSNGFPVFEKNTLEQSIIKLKEELIGVKEIVFRGSDISFGVVSSPGFYSPASKDFEGNLPPIGVPTQYVNTGISVSSRVDVNQGERIDLSNLYTYRSPIANNLISNISELNNKKELEWMQPGIVDILTSNLKNYGFPISKKVLDLESTTHLLLSKFDSFNNLNEFWPSGKNQTPLKIKDTINGTIFLDDRLLYGGQKSLRESVNTDTFIFRISGKVEEIENGEKSYYKIPVKFISSNYDGAPPGFGQEFNLVEDHESCIEECSKELQILQGKILFEYQEKLKDLNRRSNTTVPLLDAAYDYERQLIEKEKEEKILKLNPLRNKTQECINKCNETYERSIAGYKNYIPMFLSYTKEITTQNPRSGPQYSQSPQNTFGGWQFAGLWHRDGIWPKDHNFRSGLLGYSNWTPCDGGVNTGAWIKVDRQRVRLEYHNFATNGRDAVYSYIHRIWLNSMGKDLNDQLNSPPFSRHEPDELRSSSWKDWEQQLHNIRKSMISDLQKIKDQVLILRLRDNNPDSNRGLESLEYLYSPDRFGISYSSGNSQYPWEWGPGLFQEDRIIYTGDPAADSESEMDSKYNYSYQISPEPYYHASGQFDPNQWYKAVFIRAITSPSKPDGELAGRIKTDPEFSNKSCREIYIQTPVGKHGTNEKNKKTFCELLYVSEQILKMHRARLKTLKQYVDRRSKFYTDFGSKSKNGNRKFNNHMKFVKVLRKVFSQFIDD